MEIILVAAAIAAVILWAIGVIYISKRKQAKKPEKGEEG